jgi:hypothetical protein
VPGVAGGVTKTYILTLVLGCILCRSKYIFDASATFLIINSQISVMKVFLSYAHEQVTIAKEIAARLSANDHEVFVDKEKLSAGRNYDDLIRQKVENCDAFLFLISPESIADGKYTLSELRFMKSKYGNPSGKVLPVMVKPVLYSKIPPYLRAVTVLVPEGNAAAEVVAAIKRLGSPQTLMTLPHWIHKCKAAASKHIRSCGV